MKALGFKRSFSLVVLNFGDDMNDTSMSQALANEEARG